MQARDFCYWLQGALEVYEPTEGLTQEQVKLIQNHLNLVFVHDLDPKAVAEKLQTVHDGAKPTRPPRPPTLMRC